MVFPVIKNLSDFEPGITVPFTKTEDGDIVSFCHQQSIPVSLYSTPQDIEMRGITFERGDVFHRTMHKFFNAGETCPIEEIPWDILRVMEKLDGSMVSAGVSVHTGRMLVKSKKSFDSPASQGAQSFINDNKYAWDFVHSLKGYATPIFEWIDPGVRIVVEYDKPSLTLLHVRHNITGEYLDINQFAYPHKVREYDHDIKSIQNILETMQNFEGFVIQNKNGQMFKMKTEWYRGLHNREIKFSERSLAQNFINETLDDMKPSFSPVLLDAANRVERKVYEAFQTIRKEAETLAAEYPANPRLFIDTHMYHPLFAIAIAIRIARGQEVEGNILTYFRKNVLKTFSIEHLSK